MGCDIHVHIECKIAGQWHHVACPVPGCQDPGIRSKMNFCTEHAAALSEEERLRLRQEQRANHPGQDAAAAEEAK